MLPIILDESRIQAGVTGRGDGLRRRLAMLADAGISCPAVLPETGPFAFAGIAVLFVAGLDEAQSRKIIEAAHGSGVLVNVEDMPALCDFHVPAQLRRGDLLLTASTSGRSPGLARILRERLAASFGPEWESILASVASARRDWRAAGLPPDEVSRRTRELVASLL